jgi:hypothetical protein
MAGEINLAYTPGATLYAVAKTSTGQFLYGATPEAFAAAHWGSYAIVLAELAPGSGQYAGSFPAAAPGTYTVDVYLQAGAQPAPSDVPPLASGAIQWGGTGEVTPTVTVEAGGLDAVLDAPNAIGKGSLRQALRAMAAVLAGAQLTEADQGGGSTGTAISDFLDPATVRITSVETDTSRVVTVN